MNTNTLKSIDMGLGRHIRKALHRLSVCHRQGAATIRSGGSAFFIRPAVPEDALALYQMHRQLSKETLYDRYLSFRRPTMADMEAICMLCISEGAAFAVHRQGPADRIVGLAYYRKDPSRPDAAPELSIVVEDRFQGRGIGRALLGHLVGHAGRLGIGRMNAFVHLRNRRMRNLIRRSGYPFHTVFDVDTVEFTLHPQSGAAAGHRRWWGRRASAGSLAGMSLPF